MSAWQWSADQSRLFDEIAERRPRHVLLYGGSRSGKTFAIVWACIIRAAMAAGSSHLIARLNHNAVRKTVMLGTFDAACRVAGVKCDVNLSDQVARLPNGSAIWFSGLDSEQRVEKLLGMEFATIYLNETSQIPYNIVTMIRSRLAQNAFNATTNEPLAQRMFYDLNPTGRTHWTRREWFDRVTPTGGAVARPEWYLACQINPTGAPWLGQDYLAELDGMDTRRRARFLLGEYSDDVPGALWTFGDIDPHRVTFAPSLARSCVAIDPSVSASDTADEAGVVVVGGAGGSLYVLEDLSGRMHPTEWARVAVEAYKRHGAGAIVAEANQGGEMVRITIHGVDPSVNVHLIHASRDKATRAAPVAAMYRRGQGVHVGRHDGLEDEMTTWDPDPPPGARRWSPGRIDALVHGARYCLPHVLGAEPTAFVGGDTVGDSASRATSKWLRSEGSLNGSSTKSWFRSGA